MLTPTEIIDAISHDRATGQRPAGHFDHDANKYEGPTPSHRQGEALVSPDSKSNDYNKKVTLRFEALENPITGEITYTLVSSS